MKPSRQAQVPPGRGVPADPRRLDHRRARQGPAPHARPPSEPLRIVDLGCGNAYLTFAAERYLTDVRGLPGAPDRRRRQASSRASTTSGSPRELGVDADASWPRRIGGADARPRRPTSCSRCTPATPPPTTRSPGRSRWEAPLVLAAPCCHHDIAAQLRADADPGAVRAAHPARHPARAVRRHPHRRAARLAAAAAGLPRRRHAVRRTASTPRATPCCARCAPARRSTGGSARAGVRRAGRRPGASTRGWRSCSGDADA